MSVGHPGEGVPFHVYVTHASRVIVVPRTVTRVLVWFSRALGESPIPLSHGPPKEAPWYVVKRAPSEPPKMT